MIPQIHTFFWGEHFAKTLLSIKYSGLKSSAGQGYFCCASYWFFWDLLRYFAIRTKRVGLRILPS